MTKRRTEKRTLCRRHGHVWVTKASEDGGTVWVCERCAKVGGLAGGVRHPMLDIELNSDGKKVVIRVGDHVCVFTRAETIAIGETIDRWRQMEAQHGE